MELVDLLLAAPLVSWHILRITLRDLAFEVKVIFLDFKFQEQEEEEEEEEDEKRETFAAGAANPALALALALASTHFIPLLPTLLNIFVNSSRQASK